MNSLLLPVFHTAPSTQFFQLSTAPRPPLYWRTKCGTKCGTTSVSPSTIRAARISLPADSRARSRIGRLISQRPYKAETEPWIKPPNISCEGINLGHALELKVYHAPIGTAFVSRCSTKAYPLLPDAEEVLREISRTPSLPRAFSTVNASDDSEESYGVHLAPFCSQIDTYIIS